MSFENKGSLGPTVTVSREPDRSGNWICDGTADDVQINAAIAYVGTLGGGTVHLERGDYDITAAIVDTGVNDIIFEGAGWDTVLTLANSSNVDVVSLTAVDGWILRDFKIDGNKANQASGKGIYTEDAQHAVIDGVWIEDTKEAAIHLGATGEYNAFITIKHCRILNSDAYGIFANYSPKTLKVRALFNWLKGCETVGICLMDYSLIEGNHIYDQGSGSAIRTYGFRIGIIGNLIDYIDNASSVIGGVAVDVRGDETQIGDNRIWAAGTYGIDLVGSYNNVSGNQINGHRQHGVYVQGLHNCIDGNNINDNGTSASNTFDAVHITATAHNTTVSNNSVVAIGGYQTRHGVNCLADRCTIEGNNIYSIQSDGVHIEGADNNNILDNWLYQNQVYGINIVSGTGNSVFHNRFSGNVTAPFIDGGTDTRLASQPFQFVKEIVGDWLTTSPTGIEVDVDTEGAICHGHLPREVQQVVRLRVWAVALDAPIGAGGQMHAEFTFNAAAGNEAYNLAANSWVLANHDSEEADYVANDVIQWVIEDADVGTEISNLLGGDKFELIVMHEAGADPDGATDAVFGSMEVEYV